MTKLKRIECILYTTLYPIDFTTPLPTKVHITQDKFLHTTQDKIYPKRNMKK
jgi:hypothetical protein